MVPPAECCVFPPTACEPEVADLQRLAATLLPASEQICGVSKYRRPIPNMTREQLLHIGGYVSSHLTEGCRMGASRGLTRGLSVAVVWALLLLVLRCSISVPDGLLCNNSEFKLMFPRSRRISWRSAGLGRSRPDFSRSFVGRSGGRLRPPWADILRPTLACHGPV